MDQRRSTLNLCVNEDDFWIHKIRNVLTNHSNMFMKNWRTDSERSMTWKPYFHEYIKYLFLFFLFFNIYCIGTLLALAAA